MIVVYIPVIKSCTVVVRLKTAIDRGFSLFKVQLLRLVNVSHQIQKSDKDRFCPE